MKIKTESGVSITIILEGSSKIMLFSKPVRAIELKREETSKIGTLLTSGFVIRSDVSPQKRSMASQR